MKLWRMVGRIPAKVSELVKGEKRLTIRPTDLKFGRHVPVIEIRDNKGSQAATLVDIEQNFAFPSPLLPPRRLGKSNHNAAIDARNMNAAFRGNSVSECIIRCWYLKFESGDESFTNENRDRSETVVDD
ncbi:hypothetical protein TNCV_1927491 [Trichonephila clavipes]|nr:hypothetical protein TNCV_1927491 [Trichonephila clavipes]